MNLCMTLLRLCQNQQLYFKARVHYHRCHKNLTYEYPKLVFTDGPSDHNGEIIQVGLLLTFYIQIYLAYLDTNTIIATFPR